MVEGGLNDAFDGQIVVCDVVGIMELEDTGRDLVER